MHKRFLAAAVLAALSVSATTGFAAPSFSGEERVLYENGETSDNLTNRIRLNVDSDIDSTFSIHGRLVMENDLKHDQNLSNGVGFDQLYLGAKLSGADLKLGKQAIYLGKGLLADSDVNGLGLSTKIDGAAFDAYFGKKDSNDVTAFNLNTAQGDFNFGASYLDKGTKAYGLNADTKISNNAVLNLEYVKNTTNNASGYLAGVTFGQAVKKGDVSYTLSYRDVDANTIDGSYSTDANYANSKGFKVEANYKVTDNSTLNIYQDFVKDQNEVDKNLTHVEFTVKF